MQKSTATMPTWISVCFCTIAYFTLFLHPAVHADQVVLLDTTKEATLEWTRYPYGPQAQTPGVSGLTIILIILALVCCIAYLIFNRVFISIILLSGWRRASRTLARASTGVATSSVMSPIITLITGCGHRSLTEAQPIDCTLRFSSRSVTAVSSRATLCRARRPSPCSTTSLMLPRESHRHGSRTATS